MTQRELEILNSLVTWAAENMPGGLNDDEREVARIVGQWALDRVPVRPFCPHCLDVAPFGEGRTPWLEFHLDNPLHRWVWKVRRALRQGRR